MTHLLGYQIAWVIRQDEVEFHLPQAGQVESLKITIDSDETFVDQITRVQPGLIIYELGGDDTPWRRWLRLLKISPATKRIPILCYGSHKDVETMRFAKSIGADAVVARSRFAADMADLISRYLLVPDYAILADSCQEKLSDLALRGLEEFNRGDYFQSHESLEEAWMEDGTAGRELYRGILQVAVAYYQIERGNYEGAVKMFMRLRQWLDPLPDFCRGVDVAQLRHDSNNVLEMVLKLGSKGITNIDRACLKPVRYIRK